MLHISDNLYIDRLNAKGDVRIIQFKRKQTSTPKVSDLYDKADIKLDFLVDSTTWPSIIAFVCKQDTNDARVQMATHLHQDVTQAITQAEIEELRADHSRILKLCTAKGSTPNNDLVWTDEAASLNNIHDKQNLVE